MSTVTWPQPRRGLPGGGGQVWIESGCTAGAIKLWPCLRQKSFSLLPCSRQETLCYDLDSFRSSSELSNFVNWHHGSRFFEGKIVATTNVDRLCSWPTLHSRLKGFRSKTKPCLRRLIVKLYAVFKPLSPNNDQRQFSPDDVHTRD